MIDWLIELPAYLKTGLAFIGILIVYRMGVPLGFSILIHSSILALVSGAEYKKAIIYQLKNLYKPENWLLIIVIFLILWFTRSLQSTGRMDRTMSTLKQWFRNHNMLLGGLPAFVGLLPMPGGAIFSAPFINSIDSDNTISPELKTSINYWFRHSWEYWWPLYPGVIFAIHYTNLSSGTFIGLLFPFTLLSIFSGYIFLLRRVKKNVFSKKEKNINLSDIGSTFLPIIILITIAIAGSVFFQLFHVTRIYANLSAMIVGLIIALIIITIKDTRKVYTSLRQSLGKKTFLLLLVVFGVQSFSSCLSMPLNTDGSTLVYFMRNELMDMGIPIIFLIIIIPLISGVITGIAFAFVGASFPIVFGLLGPNPEFNIIASTTVLAYISGYTGMMLSPIHLCFVVSSEYFKTNILRVYPYLIGPLIIIFSSGLFLSGLYYLVF